MSLTDTLNNALSALTEGGLNRYRLDIPSCTASPDVETFRGEECMSGLYQYTVLFTSSDLNISASQLLSKPATLTMGTGPLTGLNGQKVVHGVVTDFSRVSGSRDQATYRIIIEPFLSLLGRQYRTHRFFVNKSVPEVVTVVLQEHGLKGWEYEFTLKAGYPESENADGCPDGAGTAGDGPECTTRRQHQQSGRCALFLGQCQRGDYVPTEYGYQCTETFYGGSG